MKKILFVLSAVILAQTASNAFVDSDYMTTGQFLQNTGYSQEIERMVKITSQDPYRVNYVEHDKGKDLFRRIYNYVAPGVNTDMDYYDHNIQINTPTWKDL